MPDIYRETTKIMPRQSLNMGNERKIRLRNILLDYFAKNVSRSVIKIDRLPEFAGFNNAEVKIMVYSLITVGLIARTNDANTSGARYGLTDLGRYFVDHRDELSQV